jgi:regulator of sigma E protease
MGVLTNIGAFVVVLGVMIFFHEFGHFITAKAFGMRVFIFSFGFGRRLIGFKWGDTDCRVSLIPLGGYVKLEGEPDDRLSEHVSGGGDSRDFTARPRWQRFVVYVAGPVMNGVLTAAILTLLYMRGFQVDASLYDRPIIGVVDPGSPAAAAGIQPGDEMLAIDGAPQSSWEGAQIAIGIRPETSLPIRIRRGPAEMELAVRSGATAVDKFGTIGVHPLVRIGRVLPGSAGESAGLKADDAILRIDETPIRVFTDIPPIVAGATGKTLILQLYREGRVFEQPVTPKVQGSGPPRIGIEPKFVIRQFGPVRAAKESVRWTAETTRQTFEVLGRLLTARISPKTMMGPLGIAQASGDAARTSPTALLYFVAVVSLQVGILNLFPLPPLDGGHLAILAGEGLLRRDFSVNVKAWIMNAGAMVLFLLIGLVLYSDLSKTSWLGRYLP